MLKKLAALVAVASVGTIGVLVGVSVADSGGGNSTPAVTPAGPEGRPPATATSQVLRAVVNADGTLARGSNGVTSTTVPSDGPGAYSVHFPRNVTTCAYVATIGLSGSSGTSPAGFISVVGRNGDPNAVYVATDDTGGSGSNRGFHLLVGCKRL